MLQLSCKTETLYSLKTPHFPLCNSWSPQFYCVSLSLTPLYNTYAWNCTALSYHGLVSLNVMVSGLALVPEFLLLKVWVIFHHIYIQTTLFLSLLSHGHLQCLHIFGSWELPAMNMGWQTTLRDPVFNSPPLFLLFVTLLHPANSFEYAYQTKPSGKFLLVATNWEMK